MDYSKKGGGTRMLDQLKARTLATGMGQTETSARLHGSHRVQRVTDGMKPGQLVSDPGLKQCHDKKCAQMAASPGEMGDILGMEDPHHPDAPHENAWPLKSGSMSHEMANTSRPHSTTDQGEQDRVKVTGRRAVPEYQIALGAIEGQTKVKNNRRP